nr:bleomycin hydrolase [Quercus suber]
MGSTVSTPSPLPPTAPRRAVSRRQQRAISPERSLNEKFDAMRIAQPGSSFSGSSVLSSGDMKHVSGAGVEQYVRELLKEPKNRLGLSALSTNNPNTILETPSTILKDTQNFNLAIPYEGTPVTNQRASGRCWIFAATNVFRVAIQQKYDIKSFELSQAYLFFWDKVEKANYYLESILGTVDEDVDSRLVSALMASPVGDGGQWDMIVNLVSKYGIVPQTLYPDSWNAQNSATMDRILTTKLREDGILLRSLKMSSSSSSDKIAVAKATMMQEVIRILTLCLGPPPAADEKFTWEFYDSAHKLKSVSLTPLQFAETTHVKKFVSLVNDPRNAFNRLLTVNHLGNVWHARPVTYVNVDKAVLKAACVSMLQKGLPIFFGSDVGKYSDSQKGIMDTALVDYELGFDIRLGMSKAERLLTGESAMTHAMVLTAVHLDLFGVPVRWRVQNSWSESAGTDGYFVMSDAWMDEFVYQAVVDPALLPKSVRDVLTQEPKDTLRDLIDALDVLDRDLVDLLALAHARLVELLAQAVDAAQRQVRLEPVPDVEAHAVVVEGLAGLAQRLLLRQHELAHRLEGVARLAPLLGRILDRLAAEVAAQLDAEVELGVVVGEVLLQPQAVLEGVADVGDGGALGERGLEGAGREQRVLGDVGAEAVRRLRVHGVAEEVLVGQAGGRELDVAVLALLDRRGERVLVVEVALAQREDLQRRVEVAQLEDRRVVEGEVLRVRGFADRIEEGPWAVDVEDFHAAAARAGVAVVLPEDGLVGVADDDGVLFACVGEDALRKLGGQVGGDGQGALDDGLGLDVRGAEAMFVVVEIALLDAVGERAQLLDLVVLVVDSRYDSEGRKRRRCERLLLDERNGDHHDGTSIMSKHDLIPRWCGHGGVRTPWTKAACLSSAIACSGNSSMSIVQVDVLKYRDGGVKSGAANGSPSNVSKDSMM